MALNRVVLVGRLTRDPEMKYTPQGVAVAQLGIAVQRFTKNETGDYDVDFFNVVAWRRTAEFASNYLHKGRLVSVDGRLQARSFVGQDGQKRTTVEIVADNIDPVGPRPEGEESAPRNDDTAGGDERPAPSNSNQGSYAGNAPARSAAPAAAASGARTNAPRNAAPADDDLDESDPFADE